MACFNFTKQTVALKSKGADEERASGGLFWIIFSTLYIATSCCISYFGLWGNWCTCVFGLRHQDIWDPGAVYLASAISFFDERYTAFVGHPGLFLMLLMQLIARLYYLIGSICIETPVAYYSFLAKNLFGLIFITKLVMTIIDLLSFYALYSLALRLFRDKWLARYSVIAFATTFSVLYYINFIVPEHLLLLFMLLSIDCAWRSYESRDQENSAKGYQYIALSAIFAVAAVFTKMMIAAPLLVLIPILLMLQKKSLTGKCFIPLRERIVSAFTFVGAAVPFALLCSYKVNWSKFLGFWFVHAPGSLSFDSSKSSLVNVGVNSLVFLQKLGEKSFQRIMSSNLLFSNDDTDTRLAVMAEFIFFICATIGIVQYYAKFKDKRRYVYWLMFLVVSISPVVLYRWSTHYLMLPLALASIFVGYFVNNIIGGKLTGGLNRPLVVVVSIIVIHLGSIALFVDAKRFDIVEYQRNWRPYYEALASIDYNGKIGIIRGHSANSLSGTMFDWGPSDIFITEFSKYFVPITEIFTDAELQKQNIQVVIEHSSEGVRARRMVNR